MASNYPDTKIMNALYSHLKAMSGGIAIAWPNEAWPPAGQPEPSRYLRVSLQPNEIQQAGVGDAAANRYRGVLQVTLVDKMGRGRSAYTEVAGQIIAHFDRKTRISRDGVLVSMEFPPWSPGPIDDNEKQRTETPVTIRWWADVFPTP